MEIKTFTLLIEPRGEIYHEILDFAVRECKLLLLVVRASLPLSNNAIDVMAKLKYFLRDTTESAEWPGTKLLQETAQVFRYNFGPECADVIKKSANALYEWIQPDLPEDLCLLKDDENPWLVSVTHEKDSYFCLSQNEKNRLLNSLPELASLLTEE